MPGKKGTKRKAETSPVESKGAKKQANNAMKRFHIDMSVIPESLKREGYEKDILKEEGVPDYLKCPTCKELFVNPEMYSCGHSICSVCLQSRVQDSCPVCKVPCYNRIPNYIVKELLTSEYPEELEKRTKQYEELKVLKEKLHQYQRSKRYIALADSFNEHLTTNFFVNWKAMMNHLITKHKDMTPPPSEEEIMYFLGTNLHRSPDSWGVVGQYLINKRNSVEEFMTWVETKKKGITEVKKWIPIILYFMQRVPPSSDVLKKISALYKLDVGDDLPVDEWRGRSPVWLKDIQLEVVHHLEFGFYGGPRFYDELEDSEDFSDSEDSSMGFW